MSPGQAMILKPGTHQTTQICRLVGDNLQFVAHYCRLLLCIVAYYCLIPGTQGKPSVILAYLGIISQFKSLLLSFNRLLGVVFFILEYL